MKEFFCGREIYPDPDGHKLYCVANGDKVYKFTSRADAERWCAEEAHVLLSEQAADVQLTALRLHAAHATLDELAAREFQDKGLLQLVALEVRRAADRLDKYLTTFAPPR